MAKYRKMNDALETLVQRALGNGGGADNALRQLDDAHIYSVLDLRDALNTDALALAIGLVVGDIVKLRRALGEEPVPTRKDSTPRRTGKIPVPHHFSDEERRALIEALVEAFPTEALLSNFVHCGLGMDTGSFLRDNVPFGSNVFYLVQWAESKGPARVKQLLNAARERNPGSQKLHAFTDRFSL